MVTDQDRRSLRRQVGAAVLVSAIVGVPGLIASPASAGELISESFSGGSTRAGEWDAPSPKGSHTPCLTAATKPPEGSLKACNTVRDGGKPDPAGQGVFQLTDNSKQDAGALVLNKALTAKNGLQIDFDIYMYNTSTPLAADGISFYLLDGAQAPSTGQPGGGLGYRGVKGAIVGIGFDQYGNFVGGKKSANSIGIRGAESAGYQLLSDVKLNDTTQRLDAPASKSRAEAKRHVQVKLSSANFLSLSIDFNDGKGGQTLVKDLDLDNLKDQPKLPATLKLGFAASTGDYTSFHELSGFSARELVPDLGLKVGGDLKAQAGKPGRVQLEVSNAASAGPTKGPVTATYELPAGLVPGKAAGPGWNCDVAGNKVTCTRPDVLKPGESAPPISIEYTPGAAATGKLTGTATLNTPGNLNAAGATAQFAVDVTAPAVVPPSVSVAIAKDGPVKVNEPTTYHLTASNAKDAGPTTGPLTATFQVPAGATVKSATGQGWVCRTEAAVVTCVRQDKLAPGAAAPPVDLVLVYPAAAAGTEAKVKAVVTTPGDPKPAGATATDLSVIAKGPALSLDLTRDGDPVAGGTVKYHLALLNALTAGPSGELSATFTAPAGATLVKAAGDGWKCEIAGATATCTRPGPLKPGQRTPPVDVELAFAADAGGKKLKVTAGTAGAEAADEITVAAKAIAQMLPPGYYIKGDVLYNAANKAVTLPAGYTVVFGAIYDATGQLAQIDLSRVPAGCSLQPTVQTGKPGGLGGLIGTVVGGGISLGSGVTQASLCYAGQVTTATIGPNGLLKL